MDSTIVNTITVDVNNTLATEMNKLTTQQKTTVRGILTERMHHTSIHDYLYKEILEILKIWDELPITQESVLH